MRLIGGWLLLGALAAQAQESKPAYPVKPIRLILPDAAGGGFDTVARALAVSGPVRAQAQPDLPTVAEAGIKGYEVSQWYGVFVPARTPQPVVDRLNREIAGALRDVEVAKRLAFDGAEPVGGTSEQLRALVTADFAKWARVIKETGIRGD